MTAAEMVSYFSLLYDVNGSQAAAGFTSTEIYDFLNKAQEELIKEMFQSSGTSRLTELLVPLDVQLAAETTWDLGKGYDLVVKRGGWTDEFWFYVGSKSLVTRTAHPAAAQQWIDNELITENAISKYDVNSYNVTVFKHPKVLLKDNDFVVMFDNYSTPETDGNGFHIDYIKRPDQIAVAVDCELNEELHRLVVENAVELALNLTFDERIRSNKINIQTGNVQ